MSPCWQSRLGAAALTLLMAAPVRPAAGDVDRALPADDLQAIIDSTTEGSILRLTPGDHRGPVTVARRITIRGEPGARLIGTGVGSTLTIAADGVVVEHLDIRGSGLDLSRDDAGVLVVADDVQVVGVSLSDNLHGIYVRGGRNVRLVNNRVIGLAASAESRTVIGTGAIDRDDRLHHSPPGVRALMGNGLHLWNASGAIVEGNRIEHARDGIYVAHTHGAVFRGNRVHDSRYAIHYMYSSDNVVAGNELWQNVAGAALMFSRNLEVYGNVLRDHAGFRAYGLLLQNLDASTIHDNTIRGNRVGLRLQNSSANGLRDNRVTGNLAGMSVNSSSRDNRFTRNRLGQNLRQIELTGPVPPTEWSVEGIGNRWDGALPMDLTGDGISEWPHHEVDLMAERRERFPYVQLLMGSLGIRAVEWALSRAPTPGVRHITDPHPLSREPRDD